ncbi:hypothetical protein HMPREF9629_00619 [Peptoanaerobacter stomatis]|uniref:Uncharacterized protein n=1 Tax=Peptoanaerobacter stomatis TaxID=796937 RepID=G9X2L2_9FIRM|nr:hypothetical protein [Peptoanaerobacter stomatis]EHL11082.1 hypothetical protein HMPREF9629_00619 [Peptoanaerobacter stomatis]
MNLLQMVIDRIDSLYPDANIYVKDMEQGVVEPCFFVKNINNSLSMEFDKRYKSTSLINVVYLDNSASAEKLNSMTINLSAKLSNVGVYADNVESNINDDSFSLAVTYVYMLKEVKIADVLMMKNKIVQRKGD